MVDWVLKFDYLSINNFINALLLADIDAVVA